MQVHNLAQSAQNGIKVDEFGKTKHLKQAPQEDFRLLDIVPKHGEEGGEQIIVLNSINLAALNPIFKIDLNNRRLNQNGIRRKQGGDERSDLFHLQKPFLKQGTHQSRLRFFIQRLSREQIKNVLCGYQASGAGDFEELE